MREMGNKGVLTLEILREAIDQLPKATFPKRIRISNTDYREFRMACDFFGIFPESYPESSPFIATKAGALIVPDSTVKDKRYEIDWED